MESSVESTVSSFAAKVTGEYRIVLTEKPPRVAPPLKVKIERGEAFPAENLGELEAEMKEAFRVKGKFTPEIIWADPGELERSTYKGQVFEKLYERQRPQQPRRAQARHDRAGAVEVQCPSIPQGSGSRAGNRA